MTERGEFTPGRDPAYRMLGMREPVTDIIEDVRIPQGNAIRYEGMTPRVNDSMEVNAERLRARAAELRDEVPEAWWDAHATPCPDCDGTGIASQLLQPPEQI